MISINEIMKLSVSERLQLVETIWNSIPVERITITEAQKTELDLRLERVKNGEASFYSWDEVKKQLKN